MQRRKVKVPNGWSAHNPKRQTSRGEYDARIAPPDYSALILASWMILPYFAIPLSSLLTLHSALVEAHNSMMA
jgi:hypothetical protein